MLTSSNREIPHLCQKFRDTSHIIMENKTKTRATSLPDKINTCTYAYLLKNRTRVSTIWNRQSIQQSKHSLFPIFARTPLIYFHNQMNCQITKKHEPMKYTNLQANQRNYLPSQSSNSSCKEWPIADASKWSCHSIA